MKILIADSFPPDHQQSLKDLGHELTIQPDLDVNSLPSAIADNEILIVRSTEVTADTLGSCLLYTSDAADE